LPYESEYHRVLGANQIVKFLRLIKARL